MITLLNCKSVRKKAGFLLVCGYYADGQVLLCFVFACFSFFYDPPTIYMLIFYFCGSQLGLAAFPLLPGLLGVFC